jgi:hypothetical protein
MESKQTQEIVGKARKNGHQKTQAESPADPSRRSFLGKVGTAATLAMAASAMTLEPVIGGKHSVARANEIGPLNDQARADASFHLRGLLAEVQHNLPLVPHPCNGDEALYPDKCGSYSKTLPHDTFARVDLNAYQSYINALTSGRPSDFESIILGGTRKLTNPQSGLAFDTEGTDSHNITVPAAPTLACTQTAAEMVEMYWASLLRDVPFSQYPLNATALQAAVELNLLSGYRGPRPVTPLNLFRGVFPGETTGPYVSQFMLQPTSLGNQPISQHFVTFVPNVDFMTTFADFLTVQNGGSTGLQPQDDPTPRYMRNGRDLSAWTHVDVLYQAYFVAFLVLVGISAPLNPGNPYNNSRTQVGFGTLGGPDIAATLAEVATRALKAVWFQKWFVHRRLRPEATGGIVHLIKTWQGRNINCTLSSDVLNSQAVQHSFNKYGSYVLSQAFPEGSPTHPSYPTGHGTVGGACITVLKFFFDENFVIPNPVMPSDDGLSLLPYLGPALTVNGELNKLGHNVSFGHGIHPGIHYRSDTDQSLLLGEATALSVLQDKAQTYNEKFTASLTKFDGTTATISNET